MSQQLQNDSDLEILSELIGHIRIAMLTTKEPDGSLKACPMATQEAASKDGYLWFITRRDSTKTDDIVLDGDVLVSYADPKASNYISVTGSAMVLQDRAKLAELWQPLMNAWFEKGKADPEAALIRVKIESAEYWSGPSNSLVRLFGLAKASVTGTYNQGRHGTVEVL